MEALAEHLTGRLIVRAKAYFEEGLCHHHVRLYVLRDLEFAAIICGLNTDRFDVNLLTDGYQLYMSVEGSVPYAQAPLMLALLSGQALIEPEVD